MARKEINAPTPSVDVYIKVEPHSNGIAVTSVGLKDLMDGSHEIANSEHDINGRIKVIGGTLTQVKIGNSNDLQNFKIVAQTVFDFNRLPSTVRCSEAANSYVDYTIILGTTELPVFRNDADDKTISAGCLYGLVRKYIKLL